MLLSSRVSYGTILCDDMAEDCRIVWILCCQTKNGKAFYCVDHGHFNGLLKPSVHTFNILAKLTVSICDPRQLNTAQFNRYMTRHFRSSTR